MVDGCASGSGLYFVAQDGKDIVGVMGMVYASESARRQVTGRVTELVIYSIDESEFAETLFTQGMKQAKAHGYTNVLYRGEVFEI